MIDVPESTLRAVLATLGWPKPRIIKRLRGGVVNPAYNVDDKAIFRFNSRDLDQRKFLREKLCYEKLRDVKTPGVLHYLEHHPEFESEILVTEKLPGRRISDDWPRMDAGLRTTLVNESAFLLTEIQKTEFAEFGAIENSQGQFATWTEALAHDLERILKLSFESKMISKDLEIEVRRAFDNATPDLTAVTKPKLVHGDFHFGNILWHEGHVSAIIDFEWALVGDPWMDLRNRTNLHDSAHKSAEIFETEYSRLNGAVDFNAPRILLYKMMNKLELLSVSAKHWLGQVSWAQANHKKIERSFGQALAKLS